MQLDSFRREPPAVRASDADRERFVEILKSNSAAGRLTDEELSARVGRALEARTLGDLQPLIADLPEGNVDPIAELVGGVVRTGLRAARVGAWMGGGAALLAVLLPLSIGLGAGVSPLAGAVAAVVVIGLAAIAVARIRRR